MSLSGEDLISSYLEWLRQQLTVKELDAAIEITTPFLDRHRDHIQIYVVPCGDSLTITDDGFTLGDLQASGCMIESPHRKKLFQVILNGFGVKEVQGDLTIVATPETFPQKKHSLIQAMLAVNDMFMTAKQRVETLFLEDVSSFLDLNDVRYSPDVNLAGKSGLQHRFDFVIPKSKNSPERLIRAINVPKLEAAKLSLFAWTDTRDARSGESKFYVFLNDMEKKVSADVISALTKYDVHIIRWTHRDEFISELCA